MTAATLIPAESESSCPHCTSDQVHKNGWFSLKKGGRKQRWLCDACGRSFSANTGTPMAYVKKRDELNRFVETMGDGAPLRKQAADLGVHPSTTFRWRHRVLSVLAGLVKPKLTGQVAMVETHVAYSRKGQRTTPQRFHRFKDGRPSRVLFFMADAGHRSLIAGSGRLHAEVLRPYLQEELSPEARLFTIGSPAFAAACQSAGRVHRDAPGLQPDEVQGMRTLLQAANGVRAGLHGWMVRFRGVATRYLHHYLAWYDTPLGATYTLT